MNTAPNYYKYLRHSKSFRWSQYLLKKSVPISDFKVNTKDNQVYIRSVDHSFSPGDFPVFFEGYSKYCWKFLGNGFKFIFENDTLLVQVNNLIIRVETLEELFIVNEVFIENVYQFDSTSEYIVFDVGANIGVTSLYFSQFQNIKKIYGFEPLKATYTCAVNNISLNKANSQKVELFNIGLSNADKIAEVAFDSKNKANVGIKNLVGKRESTNVEEIELKEASGIFKKLLEQHFLPGLKILVKIDCEGSEYDIFDTLVDEEMLTRFHIFMIEWHKIEGYRNRLVKLIASLKENGFFVKAIGSFDDEVGMLYCFRESHTEP